MWVTVIFKARFQPLRGSCFFLWFCRWLYPNLRGWCHHQPITGHFSALFIISPLRRVLLVSELTIHEENGRKWEKCLFGQNWAKIPQRWTALWITQLVLFTFAMWQIRAIAIIQFELMKWCGVYSNPWIIKDCFRMCIALCFKSEHMFISFMDNTVVIPSGVGMDWYGELFFWHKPTCINARLSLWIFVV